MGFDSAGESKERRERRGGKKKPNASGNSNNNDSGNSANGVSKPPRYPHKEHTMENFDDVRLDPFYWLRERRNPEVRRLLQRENAYMESLLAAHGGDRLCRTFFSEMRARWKEDDASLPYRDRGYWYYSRNVPNADYPIYCRRPFTEQTAEFMHETADLWSRNPTATLPPYDDEVVYLDLNLLVKELRLGYVELGDMDVSSDEQRLALTLDCSKGKEQFTIFLLDITDVNYARWLNEQSEMHRAWAEAMTRSEQPIYTSPTSIISAHRSPTTPIGTNNHSSTSCGGGGGTKLGSFSHRMKKKPEKKHTVTSPALTPSSDSCSTTKPTTTPVTVSTQRAEPVHKITRRIDVFDAADEVLWLSPTSLLYLGIDTKMRSCRVIYHDLTAPVHAEQTDIICYEEPDEAFWVSSLCFSADGRFATFTVASGSCTEVYAIPCEAGVDRCVNGVPIVYTAANEEELEEEAVPTNTCPVYCFADRNSGMDYDVDHHISLFGEGVGAWVVTMTNAPPGPEDFRVAYVLDEEDGRSCANCSRTLSGPSCWRPLFTYDPNISVEGVDCMRDYLLISVRRAAASTVLLLPVRVLWDRWRDSSPGKMPPLSLRDDTVDLRHVVCGPFHSPVELRFNVAELLQKQREEKQGENEEGYVFHLIHSTDVVSFSTRTWRIVLTHLTRPTVLIECGLEETGDTLCVRRLCEVGVSGRPYNADEYDATVVWVPSDYAFRNSISGESLRPLPTKEEPVAVVQVPVYLCWKKELRRSGENPMLLEVYGSYGDSCDIVFETERLALLDRGFVWATAGVRGGGEFGIPWRDAGRKLQRATSVNDFVSVSSYLQQTGWCAAGRLVTHGSSAGGFVVTAAMCIAPSLPLAVIASVPFVDCLTTLLDDSLPLTVCEWEEFGNPRDDSDAYRLLRRMSPMDNIPPAGVDLPHMLLVTAWNDTRVGFWESLAFTARLRERAEEEKKEKEDTGRQMLLHYCDFSSGHGGSSGRYEKLKEIAREYAFAVLIQQAKRTASDDL